jgi:hypothetical protein
MNAERPVQCRDRQLLEDSCHGGRGRHGERVSATAGSIILHSTRRVSNCWYDSCHGILYGRLGGLLAGASADGCIGEKPSCRTYLLMQV